MKKEFENQYNKDREEALCQISESKVICKTVNMTRCDNSGKYYTDTEYHYKFGNMGTLLAWEDLYKDSDKWNKNKPDYYDYYIKILYDNDIMMALFLYSAGYLIEKSAFLSICVLQKDNERLDYLLELLLSSFAPDKEHSGSVDWEEEAFRLIEFLLREGHKKTKQSVYHFLLFDKTNIDLVYDKTINAFSDNYKKQLELLHLSFESSDDSDEAFSKWREEYYKLMEEFEPLYAQSFVHGKELYERKQQLSKQASEKMREIQKYGPLLFEQGKGDLFIEFIRTSFDKAPSYSEQKLMQMITTLGADEKEYAIEHMMDLVEKHVKYCKIKHPDRAVEVKRATHKVEELLKQINNKVDAEFNKA